MRIGIVYPQIELGGDASALRMFGRAAEDLGFEHIVMYDHVIGSSEQSRGAGNPYSEHDPFHDPLTSFAFLAGVTERIELVSGIMILPQRQTVLVARQAADVDLMSGGRLRLGVGAGYNPLEYQAMGMDFSTRGKRLTEQIPYLRRLWSEELITFHGDHHDIEDSNIVPRPNRRIPIWCGGFGIAAFRRAVAMADGFIFGYGLSPDASAGWRRVQELLADSDRTDDFGAHFLLHPPVQPYSDGEVVAGLTRLYEQGATDASLFTMNRGFRHVDQHIEYMAHIRDVVDAAGVGPSRPDTLVPQD